MGPLCACSQVADQVRSEHQEDYISHEDGCRFKDEKSSGSSRAGSWHANSVHEVVWRAYRCALQVAASAGAQLQKARVTSWVSRFGCGPFCAQRTTCRMIATKDPVSQKSAMLCVPQIFLPQEIATQSAPCRLDLCCAALCACCWCAVDLPVRKTVEVPISTDKGMCGGINSTMAKLANGCARIDMEGVARSRAFPPGLRLP